MKVTGLGDIGLITDRDAQDVPPNGWTTLDNIRCVHGRIQPMEGYADFTDISWSGSGPDVRIHMLLDIETSAGYKYVIAHDSGGDGNANKIGTIASGSSITDRTRSAGDYSANGVWHSCEFNTLVILNNGVDAPQYTDGDTQCANMIWDGSTDWDAANNQAAVIRSFGNYLFALNVTIAGTNAPQTIRISDAASAGNMPTTWVPAADNDARSVVLPDTDGFVLDMLPLGDRGIIYKEDAVHDAVFIGGDAVFDINLVSTEYGLWATDCVVETQMGHVALGNGVVYVFNGQQFSNILEGKAADAFFAKIDQDNYARAFVAHNRTQEEVWFCYPPVGSTWCEKALVWSYRYNTWSYRDLPACSAIVTGINQLTSNAWDDDDGTWDNDLSAWDARTYSPISDTLVASGMQLTGFDNATVTTDLPVAEKIDIVLGRPDSWSMLRQMYPLAQGGEMTIEVGTQAYIGGPVTWGSSYSFDPGTQRKINLRKNTPVVAVRISGSADWSISGYEFDMVATGQR